MESRDSRIDWLKTIGIILVVFGHCPQVPYTVYCVIYGFHIPLFFMIAGYLTYRKTGRSLVQTIRKKAKTILIPYVVFWGISLVISQIFFEYSAFSKAWILQTGKGLLLGDKYLNVQNFPLWFLPTYFICSILFTAIMKFSKRQFGALLIIAGSFCSVWLQHVTDSINRAVPWSFQVIPAALFFMLTGYGLATLQERKGNWKAGCKPIGKILLIAVALGMFMLGAIEARKLQLQILYIGSYRYLTAAIFMMAALYVLCGFLPNWKRVLWIGQMSLVILGLHRPLIEIFTRLGFEQLLSKRKLVSGMVPVLYTLLAMSIILGITAVYQKLKRGEYKRRTSNEREC